MKKYEIQFTKSAAKEFRLLPLKVRHRIASIIDKLQDAPYPDSVRKLRCHKYSYRIRVGNYRIIYEIHDNICLIKIVRVRHRRDVYRRKL
ncbi:mRNA interferase RelE/StbE [Candidatus Magnetomoraceae bacterium gMMP-15]